MIPPNPREPSDEDLDRLLQSRLKRTSPEFELRWRELRGRLAAPVERVSRPTWLRWVLWPGLATLGAAALAVGLMLRSPQKATAPGPLSFEELVALDAALAPAASLLDAESRDAVIHLPAPARF